MLAGKHMPYMLGELSDIRETKSSAASHDEHLGISLIALQR